ncbi:hypothetical protein TUBRATIS_29260, partial [Tubulinosema ratisbonensis]
KLLPDLKSSLKLIYEDYKKTNDENKIDDLLIKTARTKLNELKNFNEKKLDLKTDDFLFLFSYDMCLKYLEKKKCRPEETLGKPNSTDWYDNKILIGCSGVTIGLFVGYLIKSLTVKKIERNSNQ